jgi:serine/threonine protein phosphatase 1
MSKWRPSDECLYVIPDVHGANDLLEKILKRILPLRTTGGVQDQLVFLGDYIDRHVNTPQTLDRLIELKKEYPDNIHFLMGNHEMMMLEALGEAESKNSGSWRFWIMNGGYNTVVGYCDLVNQKSSQQKINPHNIKPHRLRSLVPDNHINFLKSGKGYHKHGDFLFVHGGCNPAKPIEDHPQEVLIWDRSLLQVVLNLIERDMDLPWEPIYVTGHNCNSRGVPVIKDKFMMLDCGSPKRLLVVELNSNEAFMAYPNKKRLLSFDLEETSKETARAVRRPR